MAQKKNNNFNQIIDNHPIKAMAGIFSAGFGLCFIVLQFYYSNRIEDIKENFNYRFDQQKKDCESQINYRILEVQNQEREKYYLKLDENSVNGKLLERILEYNSMKGGQNEK